jgi:hypothetical protein
MLGNSVRGLNPMQKHLLYQSCVVPVMTYGLRLWYFRGAHVQGSIKAVTQIQSAAARWITGCFRTTPIGGLLALAGLLPMNILLKHLAEKGALRASLLAPSHPLRSILGESLRGTVPAHPLGLTSGGVLAPTAILGPASDSMVACTNIAGDEIEPFGPKSYPGTPVLDLWGSRVSYYVPLSKDKDDISAYICELDEAWVKARADPSSLVVAADGSVPRLPGFQAVACALIFWEGVQVGRVVSAAGRRTPPEVERFAIQIGISWAVAHECATLVVFSDSKPALDSLLQVGPRSG